MRIIESECEQDWESMSEIGEAWINEGHMLLTIAISYIFHFNPKILEHSYKILQT